MRMDTIGIGNNLKLVLIIIHFTNALFIETQMLKKNVNFVLVSYKIKSTIGGKWLFWIVLVTFSYHVVC